MEQMKLMNQQEMYAYAMQLASSAHYGQYDKGGMAYINHPVSVAMRCSSMDAKIVAILHDIIEDTKIDEDYLLKVGFAKHIVGAVSTMTHRSGESYFQYVERVKQNPLSKEVKLHDLEENMDIRRLPQLEEKDFKRLNKYLKAYRFLLSTDVKFDGN